MKKHLIFYLFILVGLFVACSDDEEDNNNSGSGNNENNCEVTTYPNAPEQAWFTSFNGSGEESHGHYIMTCSDGGYLQIGETGYYPNSAKLFVVKTDSNGNFLWEKEFADGTKNLGNSAIELDDGYLICGALNNNSTIIKINKNDGSTIFQKTHELGGTNAFEHVAVSSAGLIAVGYVNAADATNTFFTEGEGHIAFLSNSGDLVSTQNINSQLAQAYRIQAYNGDFLIQGLTAEAADYGLMKIDAQGNVLWNKVYGGTDSDHCFGMDMSSDGHIFLTGHTLSGTANWDTYTMKIDSDGNQVWETKQGNPRGYDATYIHDETWGIKSTSDGGCIIVAGTGDEYDNYSSSCANDGDSSDIWHVYLVKYDASGNVAWQKTYSPGTGQDWAGEDIDLTTDGGAIISVDNGQFGFLKTNPF